MMPMTKFVTNPRPMNSSAWVRSVLSSLASSSPPCQPIETSR